MEKHSARQTSAELRTNKRKGTRSVSTLTPSQLARKRANDREAQRAIRARTKEHIERLECELDQLKSKQNRDEVVRELLRKNKDLEDQLARLKTKMRSQHTDHYQNSGEDDIDPISAVLWGRMQSRLLTADIVYENEMPSLPSSGVPSLSSSYGQSVRTSVDGYGYSHIPTPEPSEPWTNSIPVNVPSTVSSPSSSGPMEDYGYIPPSLPAIIDGINVSANAVPYQNEVEYEDNVDSDRGFPKPPPNHVSMTNPYPMHPQPQQWGGGLYYYPQSPSL